MGYGIIVFESFGKLYTFSMADDRAYDGFIEEVLKPYDVKNFRGGKKEFLMTT